MTRKASAAVIILIVLIIISLAMAGGCFYLYKQERDKSQELALKLEDVGAKQHATEAKLKDSEKLISDTKAKLQEAEAQIDGLKSDLLRETTARQEISSRMEQLNTDLEAQKKSRADLEKKYVQTQDALRKTQDQLKDLGYQKTELETKVKTLEANAKSIELGNIVVTPESVATPAAKPPLPAKPTKAKEKQAEAPKSKPTVAENKVKPSERSQTGQAGVVMVINKDYNFAVINLGTKDGISIGDAFSVYHNNNYIGDIKVEKVHDSMSAAGFLSQDIKDKISEGDEVLQKGK